MSVIMVIFHIRNFKMDYIKVGIFLLKNVVIFIVDTLFRVNFMDFVLVLTRISAQDFVG